MSSAAEEFADDAMHAITTRAMTMMDALAIELGLVLDINERTVLEVGIQCGVVAALEELRDRKMLIAPWP